MKDKEYRIYVKGFEHYRNDWSDGVQTAVYFDCCDRKCRDFCIHKFLKEHSVGIDEPERNTYTVDELIQYLLKEQRMFHSRKISIVFTGGEPLRDVWTCVHLARVIKEAGMGVIFRTCGNVTPDHYDAVAPYTDLFLFDMITVIPTDHKRITGFSMQKAFDALRVLNGQNLPYRLRFRIIKDVNTSAAIPIAAFCKSLRNSKSVILDFSESCLSEDEIRLFRAEFLKRGVVLY